MNTDHHFNLLLVEDVVIAQKIASMVLENLGCAVNVASDGETALKMVQKNHYDLIFMDIGLPGMDGLATARAIRQLEQGSVSTPIVALTAHGDDSYKALSFESGMNEFINKPITQDKAEAIINKLMHGEIKT